METLPKTNHAIYALLIFEKPIIAPLHSVVIASRLDADINIYS